MGLFKRKEVSFTGTVNDSVILDINEKADNIIERLVMIESAMAGITEHAAGLEAKSNLLADVAERIDSHIEDLVDQKALAAGAAERLARLLAQATRATKRGGGKKK